MDDASKLAAAAASPAKPDRETTRNKRSESFVAYMDDSAGHAESGTGRQGNSPGDNKATALDSWFSKRPKGHHAPRLLDVPNEALISNGGPLQITGNITLVNEDGTVSHANHLTLCRCGYSQSKPNCDNQHLEMEFLHSGKIQEASEAPPSSRPSKITISCIKDGPVTFRGRLKLRSQFGQECVKMRGSLCRCGQSTSKPFCDGSHERVGFKTGR